VSVKSLLFIDACQYQSLYLGKDVKKALLRLEELQNYIFVTQQVVDEVLRGKVQRAADFIKKNRGEMELKQIQGMGRPPAGLQGNSKVDRHPGRGFCGQR